MKVKDELAGKEKRCPQCQQMISIPSSSTGVSSKPKSKLPQSEEDFPYFDDIPVRPIGNFEAGAGYSSPLRGDPAPVYESFDESPPSKSPAVSGTAAGIAGELLRKIESTDRKSRGSGAANKNKKKRRIFGDVEDQMSSSEVSASESFMMLVKGFFLPLAGLTALVVGAYLLSNYYMGPDLELPPLARVHGSIKIDGMPVRNARIEFHPEGTEKVEGGKNLASSMAISDGNGNFELFYGANIPGAVIGKHLIMISAQDQFGRELVPPDWNSASHHEFEVVKGSNKVNLEIQTAGLGETSDPNSVLPPGSGETPESAPQTPESE